MKQRPIEIEFGAVKVPEVVWSEHGPMPGNCYEASMVFLVQNRTWRLVHGNVRHQPTGERMGHAWCEKEINGVTWCADAARQKLFPAVVYYLAGNIREAISYSFKAARKNFQKHEHCGPWDDSIAQLAHNTEPTDE